MITKIGVNSSISKNKSAWREGGTCGGDRHIVGLCDSPSTAVRGNAETKNRDRNHCGA